MIEDTQPQRALIANVSTSIHGVCWMSEENMVVLYVFVFMQRWYRICRICLVLNC